MEAAGIFPSPFVPRTLRMNGTFHHFTDCGSPCLFWLLCTAWPTWCVLCIFDLYLTFKAHLLNAIFMNQIKLLACMELITKPSKVWIAQVLRLSVGYFGCLRLFTETRHLKGETQALCAQGLDGKTIAVSTKAQETLQITITSLQPKQIVNRPSMLLVGHQFATTKTTAAKWEPGCLFSQCFRKNMESLRLYFLSKQTNHLEAFLVSLSKEKEHVLLQ